VWVGGDRLHAFDVTHGCVTGPTCVRSGFIGPLAQGERFAWTAPVVVGGVAFTATQRPYGFDAACTGSCAPIWTGPPVRHDRSSLLAPVATPRAVYYCEDLGALFAYAP
jgi:hypothetical protein